MVEDSLSTHWIRQSTAGAMAREERDQRQHAFAAKSVYGNGVEAELEDPVLGMNPQHDGAHRRLSRGQIIGLAIFLGALLFLGTTQFDAMLQGLHLLFFVGFMGHSTVKLAAAFTPRA